MKSARLNSHSETHTHTASARYDCLFILIDLSTNKNQFARINQQHTTSFIDKASSLFLSWRFENMWINVLIYQILRMRIVLFCFQFNSIQWTHTIWWVGAPSSSPPLNLILTKQKKTSYNHTFASDSCHDGEWNIRIHRQPHNIYALYAIFACCYSRAFLMLNLLNLLHHIYCFMFVDVPKLISVHS